MATYVEEATRGRTLHLLKLDSYPGQSPVYLDATTPINAAQKEDADAGFPKGGPAMAQEIEKARSYADYVALHAKSENLHQFSTPSYSVFTETKRPLIPRKGKAKKTDVRTHVSV